MSAQGSPKEVRPQRVSSRQQTRPKMLPDAEKPQQASSKKRGRPPKIVPPGASPKRARGQSDKAMGEEFSGPLAGKSSAQLDRMFAECRSHPLFAQVVAQLAHLKYGVATPFLITLDAPPTTEDPVLDTIMLAISEQLSQQIQYLEHYRRQGEALVQATILQLRKFADQLPSLVNASNLNTSSFQPPAALAVPLTNSDAPVVDSIQDLPT